jgi:hypothetical protein
MKYFAGLDVALEETPNCGVDETGRIMKETRAAGEPEARDALLSNLGLPLERFGLQACALTAWLHKAAGRPAGDRHGITPGEGGDRRHAEQDRPQVTCGNEKPPIAERR